MTVRLEIVTPLQSVYNATQDVFLMTFGEGAIPDRPVESQTV
jgi:hypothetical protein